MSNPNFRTNLSRTLPNGLHCQDDSSPNMSQAECQIVCGDLDYIANQTILRNCFELQWDEWEEKIRSALDTAHADNLPMASLYARARGISEIELLNSLARLANDHLEVRALFHFFSIEGMARALDIYEGRPLINHISGECWALEKALPMLKKYPVSVVVQPIDDAGIPATAAARIEVAMRVADMIEPFGIDRGDIYVDGLTPSIETLPFPLQVSLETISAAKEAGFGTILWPANAGLGCATGTMAAGAYAALAVQAGLDLAVVASSDRHLIDIIKNANLILKREIKS
ncbi:hypothetical protein [Polynucleobacter sp.]|jgi:hypothetical protein|uniref:hypothetical protein n=1 Tax=Polynucleobacter sp. TaxID=2029855 RepID=UPI0037C9DD06